MTKGEHEVAPLKVNYIELLNVVNDVDFDLLEAANVIGRDTALTISLLQMVNRLALYIGKNGDIAHRHENLLILLHSLDAHAFNELETS